VPHPKSEKPFVTSKGEITHSKTADFYFEKKADYCETIVKGLGWGLAEKKTQLGMPSRRPRMIERFEK